MCPRITRAELREFSTRCGGKALLYAPVCGRMPRIGLGSMDKAAFERFAAIFARSVPDEEAP
jgi:hypothetical protein